MADKVKFMCIYDLDKVRCLRQEKTLEEVLAEKKMKVIAISNYGEGSINRAGIADRLPALEINEMYWCKKPDQELTHETLSSLIDTLVEKGIIEVGYED